ncbi:MAG: DUF559 domain-containing protein [Myxococcales bacterium]|nr:DUF559 domain-containing protein [Myxococcales bacterium]
MIEQLANLADRQRVHADAQHVEVVELRSQRLTQVRPRDAGDDDARLDFRFEGTNVVIEADGFAWHVNPVSFEKDRQRANALAARGFVVLHWTWAALEDRPDVLVAELQRALSNNQRRAA